MWSSNLAMTHAVAGARFGQQVRGVGHRFKSAGNRDLNIAGADLVRTLHDGLEPGATAHLIHRRRGRACGEPDRRRAPLGGRVPDRARPAARNP